MNNITKGSYGYMKKYQKGKLCVSLVLLAMIVFIVSTMYIMFGDTKRVGIVFAILLSLPFAKYIISFIVVAGFKGMKQEDYEHICEQLDEKQELVLYDVVISKYEGMKFFYSVCIKNGKLYALCSSKDFDIEKKKLKEWLLYAVADKKYEYKVQLFTDVDEYIKKIKLTSAPKENTRLVDEYMKKKILEMGV